MFRWGVDRRMMTDVPGKTDLDLPPEELAAITPSPSALALAARAERQNA